MNVKKDIVKPILITITLLLLVMVALFVILHFCFPLVMGKFCFKLGMDKQALFYLEKSYEKSEDYGELYNVLNLSIKLNDNKKIITYYEKFENNKSYNTFIANIDEENLNLQISPLALSKLYSEDNYLKNRYAFALVKNNEISKAYNYAFSNFSSDVNLQFISPYVFTYVISENNLNSFNELNIFSTKLEEYFNNLLITFNENKTDNSMVIELLVIGNRINEVTNNLKSILKYDNSLLSLTVEEINENVRAVNTAMAQLI